MDNKLSIGNYQSCSTSGIRALDLQLIAQIQKIAPGLLSRFDYLPVSIGAGCHPYLQTCAVRALDKAIAASRGRAMKINSAYRTVAQQAVLYRHYQYRRCGIRVAALPGRSNHETGLAIDIEDAAGWRPYLERFSWDWIGSFDPMHFDFEGAGRREMSYLSILAFQQLYNSNNPSGKIAEDGVWGIKTNLALMQTLTTGFSSDNVAEKPVTTYLQKGYKTPSLRWKDKGDRVAALQKALNRQGIKIEIDADFGNKTLEAVKTFQKQQGLVDDGVVGMATRRALGLG